MIRKQRPTPFFLLILQNMALHQEVSSQTQYPFGSHEDPPAVKKLRRRNGEARLPSCGGNLNRTGRFIQTGVSPGKIRQGEFPLIRT